MTTSITTTDAFLGDRLLIEQLASGFRSGHEAVLLGASLPDQPVQSVLDLGCGSLVAGLAAASHLQLQRLYGVEIRPEMAQLARRNAARNVPDLHTEVFTCCVSSLAEALRSPVDLVLCNPPFFAESAHRRAAGGQKQTARSLSDGSIADWAGAIAGLMHGNSETIIALPDRGLPVWLRAFRAEGVAVTRMLPLCGRPDTVVRRFLIRLKRGDAAGTRLLPEQALRTSGGSVDPGIKTVLQGHMAFRW